MANNIETYSGKSIAQQLLGDTKLGKWLWGNNTYVDGYDSARKDASFKESANGQLVKRISETAKDVGNLVATGLAFGNPLTAGHIMSPLITASQAYWTANGINDGQQRIENLVEDPNLQDVAILTLDVAGAVPVAKTIIETSKQVVPTSKKISKNAFNHTAKAFNYYSDVPLNKNWNYRIVGKTAIDDAKKSRKIRSRTMLHHDSQAYIREHYPELLSRYPNATQLSFDEFQKLIETYRQQPLTLQEKIQIRPSTNHNGTVHFNRQMPYPNYNITGEDRIIIGLNPDNFIPGHAGKIYKNMAYNENYFGSTLMKNPDGTVINAELPINEFKYLEYNPKLKMWKLKRFYQGGNLHNNLTK